MEHGEYLRIGDILLRFSPAFWEQKTLYDAVRIGIDAPKHMDIYRHELLQPKDK